MDQWGKVQVGSLSFESVQKLIKAKIRPYFNSSSNDVDIALAYSRNITIHVVGEVVHPGSYSFPALEYGLQCPGGRWRPDEPGHPP